MWRDAFSSWTGATDSGRRAFGARRRVRRSSFARAGFGSSVPRRDDRVRWRNTYKPSPTGQRPPRSVLGGFITTVITCPDADAYVQVDNTSCHVMTKHLR